MQANRGIRQHGGKTPGAPRETNVLERTPLTGKLMEGWEENYWRQQQVKQNLYTVTMKNFSAQSRLEARRQAEQNYSATRAGN